MRAPLHWLDGVVLVSYVAGVLAIGWLASRRQKSAEDYYLGGRRMAWWAIAISILANSYSGASLIGQTGQGFAGGMAWLLTQLGDLIGFAVVALFFLPFYSRLRLTSAYEYLERRFGVLARTLASGLFLFQWLLRAGILVYAPALLLDTVFGIDEIAWAIVGSAAISIVYCSMGGLVADVWTDVVQLVVVFLGLGFSIAVIASDVGGIDRILAYAIEAGKFEGVAHPFEIDLAGTTNIAWALLAYGTLALSIQGTNQQSVQRYMACRDLPSARRAAFAAWGIGLVATAFTLFFGIALAAWTALVPDALGSDPTASPAKDEVFLAFITTRLPPGMVGLMAAALFAAAMSSIDSAIQSLSTAANVDFVQRFRRTPLSPRAELWLARALTVAFGLAAVAVALVASRQKPGLLETTVTWLGMVAGPLLGLFLLGMLSRRANQAGAVLGLELSAAWVVAALALELPDRWAFHRLWLAPSSALLGFAAGWLASLAGPAPAREQVEGLTLRGRARNRTG